MLSFSILAPSVIGLFSHDAEIVVFMDVSEKEKEGKTEIDQEKKILQDMNAHGDLAYVVQKKTASNYYLDSHSNHAMDILVPPPEHIA